jgi:hypothetical protein
VTPPPHRNSAVDLEEFPWATGELELLTEGGADN